MAEAEKRSNGGRKKAEKGSQAYREERKERRNPRKGGRKEGRK